MFYWKYSSTRTFFINEYWIFVPASLLMNYAIIRRIKSQRKRVKEFKRLKEQLERERTIRKILLLGLGFSECAHFLMRGGDLRFIDAVDSDYMLSIDDIQAWENQHGEIGSGYLVLLRTGWQEKWHNEKTFLNKDVRGNMHFPGFGVDAAKLLIEKRNIAGIGIDTHGVDGGKDTSFSVNRLILNKPRIVLENLTNLEQLPHTGITVVLGILRLQGGSGSPGGVIALV